MKDVATKIELSMFAQVMEYTNWRGEVATRRIIPLETFFGATKWHPEYQWLMTALDVDKGAFRDFALRDCNFSKEPLSLKRCDDLDEGCVGKLDGMIETRDVVVAIVGCFKADVSAADVSRVAEGLGLDRDAVTSCISSSVDDGTLRQGERFMLQLGD